MDIYFRRKILLLCLSTVKAPVKLQDSHIIKKNSSYFFYQSKQNTDKKKHYKWSENSKEKLFFFGLIIDSTHFGRNISIWYPWKKNVNCFSTFEKLFQLGLFQKKKIINVGTPCVSL